MQKRDIAPKPRLSPPPLSFGRPLSTVDKPAKGLLDPKAAGEILRLARYLPSGDLSPFVGYFWLVEWGLDPGEVREQRTISDASVHLVFGKNTTGVFGVVRGPFVARLADRGRVLGVRFLPGSFRPIYRKSMASLTDRVASLREVFGVDDGEAEGAVLAARDDEGMVRAAEALLRPRLPPPDETAGLVTRIVQRAAADVSLTRVDDLASMAGVGMRDLQRLFREYVGVSPKWVIRRYRLQEVAHRLAGGQAVDLTRLAYELGYADQAHLTRDFRQMIGRPPSAYRADNAK